MALTPHARFTDRRIGDLGSGASDAELDERRRRIHPSPWTWLRQVHGAHVVVADRPGQHAGAEGDAIVTVTAGVPISVRTADCAPILLVGDGSIAVVHAGWQGLVAGVIEAAATTMADLGRPATSARLGPCIRARCYEFGADDLATVAARYGPTVVATTAWGTPALDLGAGVGAAVERLGLDLLDDGVCTACSPAHWSHRARTDPQRQALVAWLDDDAAPTDGLPRVSGSSRPDH